jgi:hypothetical protein
VETDEEDLIIAPVPALVAVLLNLEDKKGAPLTEAEVLEIRDNAACIVMPRDAHASVVESRGYADIDPARVWEEWSDIRVSLRVEARNP